MKSTASRSLLWLALALVTLVSACKTKALEDLGLPGPDIDRAFWGRWARIDTQEFWYFADKRVTKILGDWYKTIRPESASSSAMHLEDGTSLAYVSTNEISGTDSAGSFSLRRAQKTDGHFSGRIMTRSSGGRALVPVANVSLVIQNILNESDLIPGVKTDDLGVFAVSGAKIGDGYSISVQGEAGTVFKPENEGGDVGIYTVSAWPTTVKSYVSLSAYAAETVQMDALFVNFGIATVGPLSISISPGPGIYFAGTSSPVNASGITIGQRYTYTYSIPGVTFDPISGGADHVDRSIGTIVRDVSGKEWENSHSIRLYLQRSSIAANGIADKETSKLPVALLIDPDEKSEYLRPYGTSYPYRSDPYSLIVSAPEGVASMPGWYYTVAASASGTATPSPYFDLVDPATSTYLDPNLSQSNPAAFAALEAAKAAGGGGLGPDAPQLMKSGEVVLAYIEPNEVRYFRIDLSQSL